MLSESEWQHADGVGMCAGYDDPCDIFENCYVVDLMSAALDALADAEVESASALPI